MAKIFYDKLLDFKKLDGEIKKVAKTPEEREEIWLIVDEIIHHKALGCILDKLPADHHSEFMEIFYQSPHDEDLLFGYLREKADENIEEILRVELEKLAKEILENTKNTP